tara:strand:- start:524 stop:1129 length:606 start_codon:yes stop_codon:yes gene_type:complete
MSFRRILKYPDNVLTKKSSPVSDIDEDIKQLVVDLADTLNVSGGVGLSAPQIGTHKRVIYVVSDQFTGEMINPSIETLECLEPMSEGCLSFPGVSVDVPRYGQITVSYMSVEGEQSTQELSGLAAQIVQHEIDHLDGVLMIDKLSRLKRSMALKRLQKVKKTFTTMLDNSLEKPPRRIKVASHLSKKEKKKRRARRKQNRQ